MDGRWKDLMGGAEKTKRLPQPVVDPSMLPAGASVPMRPIRQPSAPPVVVAEPAAAEKAPVSVNNGHVSSDSAAAGVAAGVPVAEAADGALQAKLADNDRLGYPEEDAHYVYHRVQKFDSVQGLRLRYNVDLIALKRHNDFPGEAIHILSVLRIPKHPRMPRCKRVGSGPRGDDGAPLDPEERLELVHAVMAAAPDLSTQEATLYLELCAWDTDAAAEQARQDARWEQQGAKRVDAVTA